MTFLPLDPRGGAETLSCDLLYSQGARQPQAHILHAQRRRKTQDNNSLDHLTRRLMLISSKYDEVAI